MTRIHKNPAGTELQKVHVKRTGMSTMHFQRKPTLWVERLDKSRRKHSGFILQKLVTMFLSNKKTIPGNTWARNIDGSCIKRAGQNF